MIHELPLRTVVVLVIVTALIVLLEPVWTKYQDALVSWWRRRRGARQQRRVSPDPGLEETQKE